MTTVRSTSLPDGGNTQPGNGEHSDLRVQGQGREHYDLIVIGAGAAGIAAARTARRSDARVLMVTRGRPGQNSQWSGTIPSKALIAAARTAQLMRTADRFGITPVEPVINFGSLTETIRDRITTAAPDESVGSLRDQGIELVFGTARFTGETTLTVDDTPYDFSRAVIATGSAPAMPPIPGLSDCAPMTPESLWDLRFLPERLTLIGGGPTGCELGQAFARLGSQVMIIEQADRILPREEPDVSRLISARLTEEGVQIVTGTTVQRVTSYRKHCRLSVSQTERQETQEIEGGMILVAAGRRPVTAGLDLARAGVFPNASGYIDTDDRLRTSNRRIFAAGDVLGGRPLASLAELDGEIAGNNATSSRARTAHHELGPQVVFTDPEVGRIGHTEASARAVLGDWLKVRTSDRRVDRAIAENEPAGLTKIISNGHGRLVGATVVSPRAGEVITELATVLRHGGRIRELADVPHAYPTWSDAVWNAAQAEQSERQQTLIGRR